MSAQADQRQVKLLGSVIVPGVARRGQILELPDRLAEAYELGRKAAVES